jgi:hypothetical protein
MPVLGVPAEPPGAAPLSEEQLIESAPAPDAHKPAKNSRSQEFTLLIVEPCPENLETVPHGTHSGKA